MQTQFKIAVSFSIGLCLSAIIFFSVFDYRLKTAQEEYEQCTSEWDSSFEAMMASFSRIDSVSARRDTLNATLMQNDQFLWNKIKAIADSTNVNIQ